MSSRPPFRTKTAWDALVVESGEETEEEVFDETPSSQPERYVDVLWPACHDALNYPLTARANPL